MPITLVSIFSLFFPAVLICGGAYLTYRGLVRLSVGKSIKGKTSCPQPVLSHASKTKCAYSRTIVERYGGGTNWIPIVVLEAKTPFSIGREKVAGAAFEVSKFNLYKGYAEGAPKGIIRRTRGLLSGIGRRFVGKMRATPEMRPFNFLWGYLEGDVEKEVSETDQIPEAVIASLLSHVKAAEVKTHLHRPLRIREYVLPEGALATLLRISGAEPLVSDMDVESARTALRERSFLGIVAGATFILVGVLVALFIAL